jgi:hypothetical protein
MNYGREFTFLKCDSYLCFTATGFARPEEMRTDRHTTTLIWLLQQLGASQRTLRLQGFMVFFPEAIYLLQRADD